jgi:uncharacterized protein (DUF952 family)
MALIYHIAFITDWQGAQQTGNYTTSSRGRSLDEEGFIHASTSGQVATVANTFYRGAGSLLLLTIETDRVNSEIRYDQVPGSAELFPHIYGPLNVDAVVNAVPFQPDSDGQFSWPREQ